MCEHYLLVIIEQNHLMKTVFFIEQFDGHLNNAVYVDCFRFYGRMARGPAEHEESTLSAIRDNSEGLAGGKLDES